MFDKIIKTEEFDITKLPLYQETNLYLFQDELLKIIPEKELDNVQKMHNFFLENPNSMCITPNKPIFKNNQYIGYTIKQENKFIPISKVKNLLSYEEKKNLIQKVYDYIITNNPIYIYTDIDEDNILYLDGDIKIIDFDNICFTDELDNANFNYSIEHQKYIFNLFSIALYYNTTIDEIYMLNNSDLFSEEQRLEIIRLLSLNKYLISLPNMNLNGATK